MIEFTLIYRGELRPNGDPAHKHVLRQVFHRQLRHLWDNPTKIAPGAFGGILPDIGNSSFHRPVGDFRFLPVISENGLNVAEVDVLLLQPEAAGSDITQSGDIDNRLKTLFDAMKVPARAGELPDQLMPAAGESPFFCVLQDDHLISKVSVETRRLLDPEAGRAEVQLVVNVRGRHVSEFGLWLAPQSSPRRIV